MAGSLLHICCILLHHCPSQLLSYYLFCLSVLRIVVAYLYCIYLLHILCIAYIYCIAVLHIFVAYLCYISLLHICIAYIYCISVLHMIKIEKTITFFTKIYEKEALLMVNLQRERFFDPRNPRGTLFRTGSPYGTNTPVYYLVHENPYQRSCWGKKQLR